MKTTNPYLAGIDDSNPWNAWDQGYDAGLKDSSTYDMIEDIAKSFNNQLRMTHITDSPNKLFYEAAIRDDIIAMAIVVKKHCPEYDMDLFYKTAGYTGTHPVH